MINSFRSRLSCIALSSSFSRLSLCFGFMLSLWMAVGLSSARADTPRIARLRCEYLVSPQGIDGGNPG